MRKHNILVLPFAIVAILEALFFGVVQAGWSSYLYVLIDRGLYSYLCENFTQQNSSSNCTISEISSGKTHVSSCVEQQEHLNLMFTVSVTIAQILYGLWGYVIYKYGTVKSKMLSITSFVVGITMLGFASPGFEEILVPGLIFIAFGGIGVLALNMKVTEYLPCRTGMFVALLNGAADSSVITFRFVKLMHDHGVAYYYPFVGIGTLHLVMGSISLVFHKVFSSARPIIAAETIEVTSGEDNNVTEHDTTSLKDSVFQCTTYVHLLWFSILITAMFTYIGSINRRLEDNFTTKVSYFTDIMSYTMLGGFIFSFMSGGLVEWQKTKFKNDRNLKEEKMLQQILPLSLTSLLAVLLIILSFVISGETFYPLNHTGVMYPITLCCCSVLSSVQYGFFLWYNSYQGAQNHVKIAMTILAVVSLLNPLVVFVKARWISGSQMFSDSLTNVQ